MVVKQAFLTSEIQRVTAFLTANDLEFDVRSNQTLYVEEHDVIIGTISSLDYLIECLAIDKNYRGENLAGLLVSEMLSLLRQRKIYHYLVYTKSLYIPLFESMNFTLLANTSVVCILEGGSGSIQEEIAVLQRRIASRASLETDFGAIVVNCNPITLGHYGLIENAAKKHRHLLVFVVEEDLSVFSYKERFSLVWLALAELENVIVLPSTQYIVSRLTFPSYFLKSMDDREEEHARLDGLIFKNYFMKELHISKRYVGTETDPFMVKYNAILKTALGDQLEIIQRYQKNGVTISASIVRKLLMENKIEEALSYVPIPTRPLLREIAKTKVWPHV
jgi:[citrate (pro-3S)-lyase] ligase